MTSVGSEDVQRARPHLNVDGTAGVRAGFAVHVEHLPDVLPGGVQGEGGGDVFLHAGQRVELPAQHGGGVRGEAVALLAVHADQVQQAVTGVRVGREAQAVPGGLDVHDFQQGEWGRGAVLAVHVGGDGLRLEAGQGGQDGLRGPQGLLGAVGS